MSESSERGQRRRLCACVHATSVQDRGYERVSLAGARASVWLRVSGESSELKPRQREYLLFELCVIDERESVTESVPDSVTGSL